MIPTTLPPESPPPKARPARSTTDAATAYMDALRAVAANLVVFAHVILIFFDNKIHFAGRGLAVTLLFILSGFLIIQSLLNRTRKPGPHLPNFLADRMARILTPLIPVVLMIALLNATVIETRMGGDGLSTGVAALVGNLLLLLDHPVFQALAVAHVDVPWRIRPYNTAEPYWTVAIEFWLYIAASLLVFGVLFKEKIRRGWLVLLAGISVPVVIWNAADGPGKSLSLIWILGGMAGFLVFYIGRDTVGARSRTLWAWITGVGVLALGARLFKLGFDPYDLQTDFLIVMIFLGLFLRLNRVEHMWKLPARIAAFFASYSYSLYLVHNTVLVIVFENTRGLPKAWSVALAVTLAQLCALLVHHAFEKRHRAVSTWLRPILNRVLMQKDAAPAAVAPVASPPAAPMAPPAAASANAGAGPAAAAPAQPVPTPLDVIGGAVAAAATAVAAGLAATPETDADQPPALGAGLAPQ